MTSLSYFLSKLGLSFGWNRKNYWQTAVNTESLLLRDAEEVLGYLCWENCEDLDTVSYEYWNIRKLMIQYEEKSKKLYEVEDRLGYMQDKRTESLLEISEGDPAVLAKRRKLEEEAEDLLIERDSIMQQANELKRQHEGLKLKIDVVTEKEGSESPKITDTQNKLREIKVQFLEHKKRRADIYDRLSLLDEELKQADAEVSKSVVNQKASVSDSFQEISVFNKQISNLRAELGSLEKELLALWGNLGKNLSRNAHEQPELLSAIRRESTLANQMIALRKSIILNQLLVDQA